MTSALWSVVLHLWLTLWSFMYNNARDNDTHI